MRKNAAKSTNVTKMRVKSNNLSSIMLAHAIKVAAHIRSKMHAIYENLARFFSAVRIVNF